MVKDFVKKYNEVLEELNTKYNADSAKGYDPLTDEQKEAMTEDQIEKWEMAEIAKFNLDSLSQTNFYFPDDKFVSAKVWNEQEQRLTAWEYRTATANIEYNKKTIADKTKDRETRKEAKKKLKKAEKKQEARIEKFAELQDMSLKKMKKLALVEAEANLDEAESAKTVVWLWNIFFLLLIPVYIFAARP